MYKKISSFFQYILYQLISQYKFYSLLSASIGFKLAALIAGIYPNISPIATDTLNEIITAFKLAGDEIFIGRDFGQTKGYSEETASMIDEEVRNIINDCYKKAKEIILKRKYVLESCAKLLIEKER